MTVSEQTTRAFKARERRDCVLGSLIGATVVTIIAASTLHLVRSEPLGFMRIAIAGVSGGIGGIMGLFIISEVVGHNWFSTVLLSLAVGILDGLLVGAAVAYFPSML